MRILAVDPGERVGWAHGELYVPLKGGFRPQTVGQDSPGEPQFRVTGHGITVLKPFALKLADVFADYDVVVYERWALAAGLAKAQVGSEMTTSQLIGIIRYLSWITPSTKLVGQWPAEMKTARKTAPAEILNIIDSLPAAHDDSHDESALLHLWRYVQKRYPTLGGTP